MEPTTGRGELLSVLTDIPWTRAKHRALVRGLPSPSQDLLGFAKEFQVNIQTCEPGFADLYPLTQLFLKAKQGKGATKQSGSTSQPISIPMVHSFTANAITS